MSNADFDALIELIQALIAYSHDSNAHPADRTRMDRALRERDEAIDTARSILVL